MGSPNVAIAICTRNRPEDLVRAVASALRNHGASEIVVVDQSSSLASRDALQSSGAFRDQRLSYVHTPDAVGLSRSRNVAISSTTAQLLAFTDDDCEVPPDWASGVVTQFSRDPELGMSFGAVLVPPELEQAGFTPSFRPTRPGPVVLADDPVMIFGLGANMIIRRSTLERVGPFDELLGAGAPLFKAGEDTDYALRSLKLGIKLATTLAPATLHYGARADEDSLALRRNYMLGMVGYLQKHARLGDAVARDYLQRRFGKLFSELMKQTLGRGRPSGLRDLGWLVQGIIASRRLYAIDRERQLYVLRSEKRSVRPPRPEASPDASTAHA